jgi:biopolymer transport protein TolR
VAQFSSVKDKKTSSNFELNLVPFIDLMCVCITFLLITAVWSQVSMLKLGTSILGQQTEEVAPIPPQDFIPFRIDIKQDGFVFTVGKNTTNLPKVDGKYDTKAFQAQLKQIKDENPTKTDVVISIDDKLPYQLLVSGMDKAVSAGFKDVGIAMGEVR